MNKHQTARKNNSSPTRNFRGVLFFFSSLFFSFPPPPPPSSTVIFSLHRRALHGPDAILLHRETLQARAIWAMLFRRGKPVFCGCGQREGLSHAFRHSQVGRLGRLAANVYGRRQMDVVLAIYTTVVRITPAVYWQFMERNSSGGEKLVRTTPTFCGLLWLSETEYFGPEASELSTTPRSQSKTKAGVCFCFWPKQMAGHSERCC